MRRLLPGVVAALALLLVAGPLAEAGAAGVTAARTLRPVDSITPAKGCVVLREGYSGVKVALVQRALGMPSSTWELMDSATRSRVRAAQRAHGLPVTGNVNRATWKAIGLAQDFCMDRWTAQPKVAASAPAAAHIEAMIAFGRKYLGSEYIYGGAGKPRYGVDCSGLVLQALYAGGLDPQPVSIDLHVTADYVTSLSIYEHPQLKHVPIAKVRRGDLVFYRSTVRGRINHIAIYLGNGRVLESVEPVVHVGRLTRTRPTQVLMPEAVRPFVG